MITALGVALVGLIFLFGFVVWVGPPYVPTLRQQTEAALDMLSLKKGDLLLELGSGDGRVARAAAQRGIRVVGIEVNPLLVLYSRMVTWRYRELVDIRWGNIWKRTWPKDTDAIYTFLLDKYMEKLDKKIIQTYHNRSVKLASFAFEIPGKTPLREHDGVFLYHYSARPKKK